MKTKNYLINQIGWLGLVLTLVTCVISCKKEESITPDSITTTATTVEPNYNGIYINLEKIPYGGTLTDTITIFTKDNNTYLYDSGIYKDTILVNIVDSSFSNPKTYYPNSRLEPQDAECSGRFTIIGINMDLSGKGKTYSYTYEDVFYTKQ